MSEKRFITSIFIEGIILTVLGLCVLILPKLTGMSFGVMLSGAFIAYGLYKIINAFVYRNYNFSIIFCILTGILLTVIGILLLFVPKISLLWLIALTGVYFLLESISAVVFAAQIRNIYHFWGCKLVTAFILFLVGLIIILGIPVMSFWVVTVLCGIGLLIKGMSKMSMYFINKSNYV